MGSYISRIDKIDDAFYICGVRGLEDIENLHQLGIKYILNVATEEMYMQRDKLLMGKLKVFNLKIMGLDDRDDEIISTHFEQMADFIHQGRQAGGVVVHCAAGISRASSTCIAYLMLKEGLTLQAAFRKVHRVRAQILPNLGFWKQLRSLEARLNSSGNKLRDLHDGELPLWESEKLFWEIVGGAGKGGVIVREGRELSSAEFDARLGTGAFVQELQLVGVRLHYKRIVGTGPARGWISVSVGDKILAARVKPDPGLALATIRSLDADSRCWVSRTDTYQHVTGKIKLTASSGPAAEASERLSMLSSQGSRLTGHGWTVAETLDDERALHFRCSVTTTSTAGVAQSVRESIVSVLGSAAVQDISLEIESR